MKKIEKENKKITENDKTSKEIIEMYKFTVISGIKSRTYLITFVTEFSDKSSALVLHMINMNQGYKK